MTKYRLALMCCLLLLCFAPALRAQTTPATTKAANIRKLLVLMDAGTTFETALETQVDLMKRTAKDIPPRFWDELVKEIDANAFLELLVPIYDKHLSADDLEALIVFYQTPSGKRLISVLPLIMSESGAAGEKYGAQVAERVIKKMQAEGTMPGAPAGEVKPPPPPRP